MDKRLILALGQDLTELLKDPDVIGIQGGPSGPVRFHVTLGCMRQFAPLEDWTLNQPRTGTHSPFYLHTVLIGGVEILALTDEPLELPVKASGFGEGI